MDTSIAMGILEESLKKISSLEKVVEDFQKEKERLLTEIEIQSKRIEELQDTLSSIPNLDNTLKSYDKIANGNLLEKAEGIFRLVFSALKL